MYLTINPLCVCVCTAYKLHESVQDFGHWASLGCVLFIIGDSFQKIPSSRSS